MIEFEPWDGGPSATISLNVPRKCIALHPSSISSSSGSTDAVPVSGASPTSGQKGKSKSGRARAPAAAAARKQPEQQNREGEGVARGETGGAEALSPLASSKEVYPVGTVVVVRSIEADPGRTLKFAKGEKFKANFQAVLGREVSWDQRRQKGGGCQAWVVAREAR